MEITKAQIKKIHTLKSLLNLEDSFYEALLFRYGVESSKELSKDKAISLIEVLTDIQKEQNNKNKNSTGLSLHRKIYFNRNSQREFQPQLITLNSQLITESRGVLWIKIF